MRSPQLVMILWVSVQISYMTLLITILMVVLKISAQTKPKDHDAGARPEGH